MNLPIESLINIALLTPIDDDPADKNCRWGAPLILWGDPGGGKSDRTRQACASVALDLAMLFLSTAQPEDLGGIPMQDGKGGVTTHLAHPGINALIEAKRGVIFIDELTCARPAVQGAGLSVVRDRIIANKYLPGGIRILAAANPPENAAGGWELALPMANRMMHVAMPKKPSAKEWAAWRIGRSNNSAATIEEGEAIVRSAWPSVFPLYQSLFASFIDKLGDDMLTLIPPEGHPNRGRAWPSGRTWAMATNLAATCKALNKEALILDCIAACVGTGPASEFAEWVAKVDMPDPEKMLKDGWTPDKRRLDICFAAYGQAVAWTLAKTNKDERAQWAERAYVLLTDGWKSHGLVDIVGAAVIPLVKAGYHTHYSPAMALVSKDLLGKLGDKFVDYIK